MATAPRQTTVTPTAPSVAAHEVAPESEDRTLTEETAADRGIEPESVEEHDHPSAEKIAAEAYAIYLAGGRVDGHDLEDWLEAERRLRMRRELDAEEA